jgi:predicted dehydrogenase
MARDTGKGAPGPTSLGWGIIGAGDVVDRKSGAAFRTVAGTHLAGAMRRNAEAVEAFARRHDVPFFTTNAQELIEHPSVGALYIATPPDSHLEYALATAAAGKPCLVEKPAGRSAEEMGAMVDAFQEAGVPLYVSYYRRHLAKFRAVQALLDSGELGSIVAVHYRLAKAPRKKNWRLSPRVGGGGQFYDLAGHVLDVLDAWFGPLQLCGSAVANALPKHLAEDAVAISFYTAQGAVGTASWNFASHQSEDELVIEGLRGRCRLQGMSRAGKLEIELGKAPAVLWSDSLRQRGIRKVQAKLKLPFRRTERLKDDASHEPMLEGIMEDLRGPRAGSGDAALRTARIMNGALDPYYKGREDDFWERPFTWNSLRTAAAQRVDHTHVSGYQLSDQQRDFFHEHGYLGPFECEGGWRSLQIPVKKGRNFHMDEPPVFEVCTHPSVVQRVSQLLGTPRIALFKSRFVVKAPGSDAEVAWHQDSGATNGGNHPDGTPVETISAWLALDKVSPENGAMRIIPGSHRRFYGDHEKRIRAELVESGALSEEEIASALSLDLEPGQFYIFHSWILHGSTANPSKLRRAGLNIRFARLGEEYDEGAEYFPLTCE